MRLTSPGCSVGAKRRVLAMMTNIAPGTSAATRMGSPAKSTLPRPHPAPTSGWRRRDVRHPGSSGRWRRARRATLPPRRNVPVVGNAADIRSSGGRKRLRIRASLLCDPASRSASLQRTVCWLLIGMSNELSVASQHCRFGASACAQLAEDVGDVSADGAAANVKRFGDFRVGHTGRQ